MPSRLREASGADSGAQMSVLDRQGDQFTWSAVDVPGEGAPEPADGNRSERIRGHGFTRQVELGGQRVDPGMEGIEPVTHGGDGESALPGVAMKGVGADVEQQVTAVGHAFQHPYRRDDGPDRYPRRVPHRCWCVTRVVARRLGCLAVQDGQTVRRVRTATASQGESLAGPHSGAVVDHDARAGGDGTPSRMAAEPQTRRCARQSLRRAARALGRRPRLPLRHAGRPRTRQPDQRRPDDVLRRPLGVRLSTGSRVWRSARSTQAPCAYRACWASDTRYTQGRGRSDDFGLAPPGTCRVPGDCWAQRSPLRISTRMSRSGSSLMMPSTPRSITRCMIAASFTVYGTTLSWCLVCSVDTRGPWK